MKRRNSGFPVSPGSAEAIVRWGGKIKYILTVYFLGNVFDKKCCNRAWYVKIIASQRWDVFWDTVYLPQALNCARFVFWRCLWLFCLCMKYLGNRWTDLRQIYMELHGRRVWSLARTFKVEGGKYFSLYILRGVVKASMRTPRLRRPRPQKNCPWGSYRNISLPWQLWFDTSYRLQLDE